MLAGRGFAASGVSV